MKTKSSKKPKIRRTWNINPGTHVMQNSKKQRRLSGKQKLRDILKRLDDEKDT
jgi:hypothetical protein